MAEMTDVTPRQGLKRMAPALAPAPCPPVARLSPSLLLLEIPANANIDLPVWDAIRSQQVYVAWTVNPDSVNVNLTPATSTQGKTPALESKSVLQPMVFQSMAQQQSNPASCVRVIVSQNPALPVPNPSGQRAPVPDGSFTVPLPLIIRQHPATPATPAPPPAKKPALASPPALTTSRLRPLRDRSLFHTKSVADVLICDSFLTGSCRMGRRCRMHHTPFPFHWQLWSKASEEWVDISPGSQVMLERVYCNIKRSSVCLKDGANSYTLYFDTMELDYNTKYGGVRRLSNSHFPSEWKIYWRASVNWVEYDKATSTLLLQKMKLNELEWPLIIGSVKYTLDHIDTNTGFTRQVRCRPIYRPPESLRPYLRAGLASEPVPPAAGPPDSNFDVDPLEEFSSRYPPVWRFPMEQDYSLLDVPEGSQAYQKVKRLFHESLLETSVDIISIQQVQNLLHWDKYQRHKADMQKQHGDSKDPLERHLFHGTTKTAAELICQNNFDPRVAGVNGAMYGLGSYFATTAAQSSNFTGKVVANKISHIFLAKVLVGNACLGKRTYRRPPPLCPKTKQHRLYDTCVDSLEHPTMFVVFDSCQCFPYYLIKYKDLPDEIDV